MDQVRSVTCIEALTCLVRERYVAQPPMSTNLTDEIRSFYLRLVAPADDAREQISMGTGWTLVRNCDSDHDHAELMCDRK